MKYIKLKLEEAECRDFHKYGYMGEHGKSTFRVDCPFCGTRRIIVYAWSFAGGGKRCPQCGAYFGMGGHTYRDRIPVTKGRAAQ